MAFQNIPQPFNENDVKAWLGWILSDLCREVRRRFYPSEFILDEETRGAHAYDYPEGRERALADEDQPFYRIARYCLEELVNRQVLRRDQIRDSSDGRRYTVYWKTQLLDALCPIITQYQLPDIDGTLEEYRREQNQQ